jgi:predicted nuclease of restriction endonuclease-like (RecB) superfamily
MLDEMTFQQLVEAITRVHREMAAQAGRAINLTLTIRNWLTGAYIVIYEQRGEDRAAYGAEVLPRLARELERLGVLPCDPRRLAAYRRFYLAYPQLRSAIASVFTNTVSEEPSTIPEILRSATAKSGNSMPVSMLEILRSATAKSLLPGQDTVSGDDSACCLGLSPGLLLQRLSYTHLEVLAELDSSLKRAFYEIECVRGGWSVRELKRQIATLYFERSALSQDKAKLAELVQATAEKAEPRLAIRDPYVFEFLGLKPHEVLRESDVEEALLDRLQAFLLELGHGFCFEARQKRILIGDTHGFVDLVFYHRILKCHVLIELKVDAFSHEHLGQLNTYVSWYRTNIMAPGDNPPIGLLLCTAKDQVLVEYALAGLNNHLFVSKYQLELPSREKLTCFLEQQRREVEG